MQHCINTVIEYGHFRLKIGGISRLTLSQRESSPCSELYCSQLPTFSKSSSMIDCLFGDVVRFYFIVLRPLWSASRCRRFMTVAYPLNKQSLPVFCPGFQKGRVPSQKGTFSAVNGLSKGHFSAVNGLKRAL